MTETDILEKLLTGVPEGYHVQLGKCAVHDQWECVIWENGGQTERWGHWYEHDWLVDAHEYGSTPTEAVKNALGALKEKQEAVQA